MNRRHDTATYQEERKPKPKRVVKPTARALAVAAALANDPTLAQAQAALIAGYSPASARTPAQPARILRTNAFRAAQEQLAAGQGDTARSLRVRALSRAHATLDRIEHATDAVAVAVGAARVEELIGPEVSEPTDYVQARDRILRARLKAFLAGAANPGAAPRILATLREVEQRLGIGESTSRAITVYNPPAQVIDV